MPILCRGFEGFCVDKWIILVIVCRSIYIDYVKKCDQEVIKFFFKGGGVTSSLCWVVVRNVLHVHITIYTYIALPFKLTNNYLFSFDYGAPGNCSIQFGCRCTNGSFLERPEV